MAWRERDNRGTYPDILGATLLQHRMGAPTCIDIASTSPKHLADHCLQPIPRIGWRIAAPRRSVRLLDSNGPAWLRHPPKLRLLLGDGLLAFAQQRFLLDNHPPQRGDIARKCGGVRRHGQYQNLIRAMQSTQHIVS